MFQITPNESLDISVLESEGVAKHQKITYPSNNKAEVTTTTYYFDDVNIRKQISNEILSQLNDTGEIQAQYYTNYTDYRYSSRLDGSCSYELHTTVYCTIYTDYMGTQGRIDKITGGYTRKDWL